jgi:hypothetical protein
VADIVNLLSSYDDDLHDLNELGGHGMVLLLRPWLDMQPGDIWHTSGSACDGKAVLALAYASIFGPTRSVRSHAHDFSISSSSCLSLEMEDCECS